MYQTIFTGWSFMRVLRLAVALVLISFYFTGHDNLSLAAGLFFGFQAIFNTGCCAGSCGTEFSNTGDPQDIENIQYQEIK